MTTHFITTEIDLQETPTELQKVIETKLNRQENFSVTITSVDIAQQTCTVEAVVTKMSVPH